MSLFKGAKVMIAAFAANSSNPSTAKIRKEKSFWFSMSVLFLTTSTLLIIGISGISAFTQVSVSTGAATGTELKFLAAMQQQFNVKVVANPLAANTYAVTLYGLNPNYNAPPPVPTTLQEALALGATVYVYGFADGQSYNQHVDTNLVDEFAINCSTPISGIGTWDRSTCQALTGSIANAIFQESLSTPTVIPGGF